MANVRGKNIDNTHLSIDQAEERGFIHRDYVGHCLRWTFIANRLQKSGAYKTARILDVGCGVDLPLAKLLYSSKLIVDQYVGIDWNNPDKIKMKPFHTGKFPIRAFGGVDFANADVALTEAGYSVLGNNFEPPTHVVCLEMVEHVEPGHAVATLQKIKQLLDFSKRGESTAFVSTPCYDPSVGAAGNHVNEMTRDALGWVFEELGFCIEANFGTFASQRDYKDKMFAEIPQMEVVFSRLREYYDSNYLATIFAPMYPEFSRNNIWVLSNDAGPRKFRHISAASQPWSSSSLWRDLEARATKLEVSGGVCRDGQ